MGTTNPEDRRPLFDGANAGGTSEEIDGTVRLTPDDTEKEAPIEESELQDDSAEELPIITEIHEMKFGDIQDLANRFFEVMKHYKEEQWTLAKIKEHSKELPSMIQELEDLLDLGGIKNPGQRKELLSAVVESAQHAKNGHEFWHSISDHKTMVPKSAPDRFYRAIVSGLQKRESVAEAA